MARTKPTGTFTEKRTRMTLADRLRRTTHVDSSDDEVEVREPKRPRVIDLTQDEEREPEVPAMSAVEPVNEVRVPVRSILKNPSYLQEQVRELTETVTQQRRDLTVMEIQTREMNHIMGDMRQTIQHLNQQLIRIANASDQNTRATIQRLTRMNGHIENHCERIQALEGHISPDNDQIEDGTSTATTELDEPDSPPEIIPDTPERPVLNNNVLITPSVIRNLSIEF